MIILRAADTTSTAIDALPPLTPPPTDNFGPARLTEADLGGGRGFRLSSFYFIEFLDCLSIWAFAQRRRWPEPQPRALDRGPPTHKLKLTPPISSKGYRAILAISRSPKSGVWSQQLLHIQHGRGKLHLFRKSTPDIINSTVKMNNAFSCSWATSYQGSTLYSSEHTL